MAKMADDEDKAAALLQGAREHVRQAVAAIQDGDLGAYSRAIDGLDDALPKFYDALRTVGRHQEEAGVEPRLDKALQAVEATKCVLKDRKGGIIDYIAVCNLYQ